MRTRTTARSTKVTVTARAKVTFVLVALMCAACSSSRGNKAAGSSSAATSPSSSSSAGSIIELSGPLSTEGFSQAKLGSDDAAKALGVSYQYSAPASLNNFAADYTALINEAIARKPAAMVIGNFIPSAFDSLIKKATAAAIPVVVVNSGLPSYQSDGAIAYVGTSSETDGEAGANAALKAGAHHLLCVDQTTNPLVEDVCLAAKPVMQKAGGTYDQLNVPLTDIGNPAALTQDIQGDLSSHPDLDGVFTAGSGFGTDAAQAVQNLGKGSSIKVGGNEVTSATLNDIHSGAMAYVIAEQPYLMGYDAIKIAAQYLKYGQYPVTPVITSGAVVDQSNVARYLAIDKQYPGVPG
jgi:simple sugar transport system substrate-binding protein